MIVLRCRHGRNCGAKSSLHPISARNDGIIHRIRRCSARKLLQCAYPRGATAACTSTAKKNDSQLLIIDMENQL